MHKNLILARRRAPEQQYLLFAGSGSADWVRVSGPGRGVAESGVVAAGSGWLRAGFWQ